MHISRHVSLAHVSLLLGQDYYTFIFDSTYNGIEYWDRMDWKRILCRRKRRDVLRDWMNEEERRLNVLELCHSLMCEVMFMKVCYDTNGLSLVRLYRGRKRERWRARDRHLEWLVWLLPLRTGDEREVKHSGGPLRTDAHTCYSACVK